MKTCVIFLSILFFALVPALDLHKASSGVREEPVVSEESRGRPMCEIVPSRASVCRREVLLVDRDFAYKWPVLYFYLDQKPENRPLTLGYISKLRNQLRVIEYECGTRIRLMSVVYAIDAQLALIELKVSGKEFLLALEARA